MYETRLPMILRRTRPGFLGMRSAMATGGFDELETIRDSPDVPPRIMAEYAKSKLCIESRIGCVISDSLGTSSGSNSLMSAIVFNSVVVSEFELRVPPSR